jgi:hypothetical protein
VAAALAIAFWVRSNWYVNEVWIPLPAKRGLGFVSANNGASVAIQRRDGDPSDYIVGYSQLPLKHFQFPKSASLVGFRAARDGDLTFVHVPYWFLVALFAAAPWFGLRFSLRTLLVGMALAAILLGLLATGARN